MSRQHRNHASPGHPPPTLQTALNLFNRGDYFACHELLEDLWLDEQGSLRDLYKGMLQIGVGLLHLQRGNIKGARNLLQRGVQLIEPFTPICFGINLAKLSDDARIILSRLEEPATAHQFLGTDAIQIETRQD